MAGNSHQSHEGRSPGRASSRRQRLSGSLTDKSSASSPSQRTKLLGGARELREVNPSTTASMPARLRLQPNPYWYDSVMVPVVSNGLAVSEAQTAAKHAAAAQLLEDEGRIYSISGPQRSAPGMSASDSTFLSRVLTSGTLSDRLSALTLMAQASPVHNIKALDMLKLMAGKKNREESLKALRAITDWWVGGGAPSRKLKFFRDQPLNEGTEKHLLVWCFEDWLKKYFFSVLQLLEVLLLDALPYVRTQAMDLVAALLKEKPEQEQNLLRLLVNKLGDPERVIASKASFHLLQLLQSHPGMKAIVIRETSTLLSRPPPSLNGQKLGANRHARYYGVITFNQIALSSSDKDIARQLVDFYFSLFQQILGARTLRGAHDKDSRDTKAPKQAAIDQRKPAIGSSDDEIDDEQSKMIAAILTGVNRALPFAALEQAKLDVYVDVLFRITHSATFNISVQALVLVFHVMSGNNAITDRFYRALYESLFDARLLGSSKRAMYLNLFFRALKADVSLDRTAAIVKRLLQVLHLHQPPFICGAIYLLGELMNSNQDLRGLIEKAAEPHAAIPLKYDPRKRDPQFAQAYDSRMWEIVPLTRHFHPSVSLHARQLAEGSNLTANADLGLNTVMHFLDRFVFRNAKKPRGKGPSAMQPGKARLGMVRSVKAIGDDSVLPTDLAASLSVTEVPIDQHFFYQYFNKKSQREDARRDKVSKRNKTTRPRADESNPDSGEELDQHSEARSEDAESVISEERGEGDEEEEEIWKAMKASMPQMEGESDVDGSDDFLLENASDNGSSFTVDTVQESGDDLAGQSDASRLSLDDLEDGEEEEAAGDDKDEEAGHGEEDFFDFDEGEKDLVTLSNPGHRKRKGEDGEDTRSKHRKRPRLPTFASYDDYAALIDGQPDDNL